MLSGPCHGDGCRSGQSVIQTPNARPVKSAPAGSVAAEPVDKGLPLRLEEGALLLEAAQHRLLVEGERGCQPAGERGGVPVGEAEPLARGVLHPAGDAALAQEGLVRSEERRVGKAWRTRRLVDELG